MKCKLGCRSDNHRPVSRLSSAEFREDVGRGTYLHIFPYRHMRWRLDHQNRHEGFLTIVYLHLWEIDPEQPRLAVSLKPKLRHYVGLDGTQIKLDRLPQDFQCAPVSEVFDRDLQRVALVVEDRLAREGGEAAVAPAIDRPPISKFSGLPAMDPGR